MICEKCKSNEATIHLTEIIKDVKSELHLCEYCAKDIGLNSKLSNFSLSIPEMLSFLDITEVDNPTDRHICRSCGFSFMDFKRKGGVGCSDCYNYLEEQFATVIQSYQQNTNHIGKNPQVNKIDYIPKKVVIIEKKEPQTLEELYKQLENAILDEEYEEAALLRDRIKEISETGAHID